MLVPPVSGRDPIVSRYSATACCPKVPSTEPSGSNSAVRRVVVALVDRTCVALRELAQELAVDQPLHR